MSIFAHDRYWLEHQKGMQHWDEGTADLEKKLEKMVDNIIDIFFEKKRPPYRPAAFVPQLWNCIAYHWQVEAGVDEKTQTWQRTLSFEEVITALVEKGRCDKESPFLKPNIWKESRLADTPLPDVVYATFYAKVEHADVAGMDVMHDYYRPACIGRVRRYGPKANDSDWWCDFENYLQGLNDSGVTTICTYHGKNHLKSWLLVTARNFLIGRAMHNNEYAYPTFEDGDARQGTQKWEIDVQSLTPEEILVAKEEENDTVVILHKKFQTKEYRHDMLKRAIGRLPKKDQTLVKLYYYDHLKMGPISQILDIDIGNVSRGLSRTRKKIKEIVSEMRSNEERETQQNILQTTAGEAQ